MVTKAKTKIKASKASKAAKVAKVVKGADKAEKAAPQPPQAAKTATKEKARPRIKTRPKPKRKLKAKRLLKSRKSSSKNSASKKNLPSDSSVVNTPKATTTAASQEQSKVPISVEVPKEVPSDLLAEVVNRQNQPKAGPTVPAATDTTPPPQDSPPAEEAAPTPPPLQAVSPSPDEDSALQTDLDKMADKVGSMSRKEAMESDPEMMAISTDATVEAEIGLMSAIFGDSFESGAYGADDKKILKTGWRYYFRVTGMPYLPGWLVLLFVHLAWIGPRVGANRTTVKNSLSKFFDKVRGKAGEESDREKPAKVESKTVEFKKIQEEATVSTHKSQIKTEKTLWSG